MAVCLAGGLALIPGLRADDVLLPGNPYASVVARNIFGLNPPPPVDPNPPPVDPPVKITPNGIMSIFGELQVLFKALKPGPPGKPPVEDDYTLSVGERQDDIEVVKIDEQAGIVTFNNHGTVQDLPLVPAKAGSAPAPVAGGNPAMPGIPARNALDGRAGNTGGNGFINTFGNRGGNFPGRNGNGYNDGNNPGGLNGSNFGNTPATTDASDQQSETREQRAAEMLVNSALYKQQGNPAYKIMPPIPGYTPPPDDEQQK